MLYFKWKTQKTTNSWVSEPKNSFSQVTLQPVRGFGSRVVVTESKKFNPSRTSEREGSCWEKREIKWFREDEMRRFQRRGRSSEMLSHQTGSRHQRERRWSGWLSVTQPEKLKLIIKVCMFEALESTQTSKLHKLSQWSWVWTSKGRGRENRRNVINHIWSYNPTSIITILAVLTKLKPKTFLRKIRHIPPKP